MFALLEWFISRVGGDMGVAGVPYCGIQNFATTHLRELVRVQVDFT